MSKPLRVFLTGSTDGLGLLAAQRLAQQGHQVYLHARNASRAEVARKSCPAAADVLIGNLSSIADVKQLATTANSVGRFDAVVLNAGTGMNASSGGLVEKDVDGGMSEVFMVNTLSTYMLAALLQRPERLVIVSSGLQGNGDGSLKDATWGRRTRDGKYEGFQAYCDTKMHDSMMALALARRWKEHGTAVNAVDPGWVPTKLGSYTAPGDIEKGAAIYVRLATGEDSGTGRLMSQTGEKDPGRTTKDEGKQNEILKICETLSGVKMPA